ncbi:MAG: hypothetical protein BWY77_00145 [bacterium ADurb.Bin431]|nr:MAG: hypothetical protein BWY77_00145 [bacterium ADurb.Bin431]
MIAAQMAFRPGGGQVGDPDPAGEIRLVLPVRAQGERDVGLGLAAVDQPFAVFAGGQEPREGEAREGGLDGVQPPLFEAEAALEGHQALAGAEGMAAEAQQQRIGIFIDKPALEAGDEGKGLPAVAFERDRALLDGSHLEKIEPLQIVEVEADLFTLGPGVAGQRAGRGPDEDDRLLDHDILGEGPGVHAIAEHANGIDADAQVLDADREGLFAGREIEAEKMDIGEADAHPVDGKGVAEDGLHSGEQELLGLVVHSGPAPGAGQQDGEGEDEEEYVQYPASLAHGLYAFNGLA